MGSSSEPVGCPLSSDAVVDMYFMEHRAKIIDIAAFLDRVDRTDGAGAADFRMKAFHDALALLSDGKADRAARVLDLFSDQTTAPIPAAGEKGATGAWPDRNGGAG